MQRFHRPFLVLLAAATILSVPTSVSAEVNDVKVEADKTYRVELTGVEFPPVLGSFKRTNVITFGSDYDLAGQYDDPDTGSFATIYVTRVGVPDVSLWFDNVLALITEREGFEPSDVVGAGPRSFIAPGFDRPSGLFVSYPVKGPEIRSSGLAMIAYDEWLVKVRVSSSGLDQPELDETIGNFVGLLKMPPPSGYERPPHLIERCSDAAEYAPGADMQAASVAAALSSGMVAANRSIFSSNERADRTEMVRTAKYCLDSAPFDYRVYRPADGTPAYVIAMGDTGRSLSVGEILVAGQSKTIERDFYVALDRADRSYFFRTFDALPAPEKAMQAMTNENLIATYGPDRKLRIVRANEGEAD